MNWWMNEWREAWNDGWTYRKWWFKPLCVPWLVIVACCLCIVAVYEFACWLDKKSRKNPW